MCLGIVEEYFFLLKIAEKKKLFHKNKISLNENFWLKKVKKKWLLISKKPHAGILYKNFGKLPEKHPCLIRI